MNTAIEINYDEILEALHTRQLCRGNRWVSRAKAIEYHMGTIAHYKGKDAEERERRQLEDGNRYFDEGYRLHESQRRVRGLGDWEVPADALAWRLVSAGHIIMSEALRLQWITKS